MAERELYPGPPRRPKPLHNYRPWGVRYALIYDDGEGSWTQYYRSWLGARISAWWKYHISSWGGTVVLFDNRNRKKDS